MIHDEFMFYPYKGLIPYFAFYRSFETIISKNKTHNTYNFLMHVPFHTDALLIKVVWDHIHKEEKDVILWYIVNKTSNVLYIWGSTCCKRHLQLMNIMFAYILSEQQKWVFQQAEIQLHTRKINILYL